MNANRDMPDTRPAGEFARARTRSLASKRGDTVAMAGDGQVTLGDVVLKHGARKIRLMHDGQVVAGFAGAVADALTLFGKFEAQLKAWDGNLRRAVGRAGQGVAHRSLSAPARSAADRRGRRIAPGASPAKAM